MAKQFEAEEAHYYDYHPTKEDLMGETSMHADLVHYLMEVLKWQFREQRCAIYENLNFYQTANYHEYPLAPDIAVIKGVERWHVRSWRVGKSGPAPQVVFEIASPETWKKDLEEKPFKYGQMGVKEYFAYDPYERPLDRDMSRRLFGWQLDKGSGQMRAMPVHPDRGVWSHYLESLLVPDGEYLRLYESNGQRRLTQAEAKDRQVEEEAEARRAETRRAEALAEKLRALGIDPDQP
jgi:Uma2 family endonuclease